MHQIEPDPLWLGNALEVEDFRHIFEIGVRAIVQLAVEEPPLHPPRELIFCRFPLVDGAGNRGEQLFLAASTLGTLLKMRLPTLVCCSGGMSRSPAIAAATLAMIHSEIPEKCLERVARYHPCDVSPGLWNEVKSLVSDRR